MAVFGSAPLVIYLTKTQLVAADLGNSRSGPWTIAYAWPNVDVALSQLAQKTSVREASLIIGEDLSYTVSYQAEKGIPTRNEVRNRLGQILPEIITDETFDWMQIDRQVQAVVIAPETYFVLQNAFAKAGMQIVTAQPICLILAERTQLIDKPVLIIFDGIEKMAILAWRGVAIDCQLLTSLDETEVSKVLLYSTKFFAMEPQTIFYFTMNAGSELKLPDQYSVTKTVVDPFRMLLERRVSGRDENVLSIKIHKKEVGRVESGQTDLKGGTNNLWWWIVALFLGAGIIIGLLWWWQTVR